MEELEAGEMEYESIEEFFTSMKREFGGGEEEATKVAELRRLEQGEDQWKNLFKYSKE